MYLAKVYVTFRFQLYVRIYLNYLILLHIDSVLVFRAYSQFIITHYAFTPLVIIFLYNFSLCIVGKGLHFTVSLHLLFYEACDKETFDWKSVITTIFRRCANQMIDFYSNSKHTKILVMSVMRTYLKTYIFNDRK